MVTIEAVGFKPRWSLILEMNFPLPVWVLCTKMIFAPEWSNARNGIYMTKSRASFNKQLLGYWVFIKGMYHWRGSFCLSSSDVIMSRGNSCELNLWCPTLVLLNQTCFLLLLSGSYGYDRSCWFQAKMIINIRNELPSSSLGSAPKWSLPMNDRMHEMAYTWQNQGPVSITVAKPLIIY